MDLKVLFNAESGMALLNLLEHNMVDSCLRENIVGPPDDHEINSNGKRSS